MKKQKKKIKKIKKTKKERITKDMHFSEVLEKYPETVKVFFRYGLTCLGCPVALQETIEQGCLAHGIDVNTFVKELNRIIKKNDNQVQ